jgi:hypothetical protein
VATANLYRRGVLGRDGRWSRSVGGVENDSTRCLRRYGHRLRVAVCAGHNLLITFCARVRTHTDHPGGLINEPLALAIGEVAEKSAEKKTHLCIDTTSHLAVMQNCSSTRFLKCDAWNQLLRITQLIWNSSTHFFLNT